MKLKKKIIATSILISILPLIFCLCISAVIVLRQYDKIVDAYGINDGELSIIQNPMIAYNSIIKNSVERIRTTIEDDPEKLTDDAYLNRLNATLTEHYACVFVKQNDVYTFKGNETILKYIDIYIRDYGSFSENFGSIYINSDEVSVLLEQMVFHDGQGEPFYMYLILEVDKFLPEIRNGFTQIVLALILILILLGVLTLLWLHRLFIKPITKLSNATHEIMEGNLNFSLKTNRKDEIGQLQNDFDDMRIHLKESTEQQINNAEAAKEMMSNITHDLKTPLTAIKGYAEGLLDGIADTPEKQERYYKTIYSKACSMEELVEDLVYFSKLDNKMVVYNFAKVPLREFLKDCMEDVAMDLELKHIALKEVYQCDEGIRVLIDPNEIKRVLLNIIGNSIKYMDKQKGCISIKVLNDDEFVWIAIEDNGKGIDVKDIPHIFQRFYRADTSRGTRLGGTGLGLSIAKSIVEAHGGTISADSIKGEGTTIKFSLPREKTKEDSNG